MKFFWFICVNVIFIETTLGFIKDLHIDVVPTQASFNASEDVKIELKYTNKGSHILSIYKWIFPHHKLFDPILHVTRNGENVAYVGPLFKRGAPTISDLIHMEPGSIISSIFELSSVYNMTETGEYQIQYKMHINEILHKVIDKLKKTVLFNGDDHLDHLLQSTPVTVSVVGRPNEILSEPDSELKVSTTTYLSCTESQTSSIKNAIPFAEERASNAAQYLNSQSSSTPRYTTWFGHYSVNNHNSLKLDFSKVQYTLSTKALIFDCSCPNGGSNVYAYVYPTQHYKIYLCDQYWNAPLKGRDSQSGTIIHELAHFTIVAGTSDHAYGHPRAKLLALNNPSKAIKNSDSFQYFSENDPFLN